MINVANVIISSLCFEKKGSIFFFFLPKKIIMCSLALFKKKKNYTYYQTRCSLDCFINSVVIKRLIQNIPPEYSKYFLAYTNNIRRLELFLNEFIKKIEKT